MFFPFQYVLFLLFGERELSVLVTNKGNNGKLSTSNYINKYIFIQHDGVLKKNDTYTELFDHFS